MESVSESGLSRTTPLTQAPAHCHFLLKVQNSLSQTACLLETPFVPFFLDSVYPVSRGLRPHCKGGPPRRTSFRGACCRDSGLSPLCWCPSSGWSQRLLRSGAFTPPGACSPRRGSFFGIFEQLGGVIHMPCHSPSKVYNSEVSSTFPERCNPHRYVISKHICLP